jgi:hypothetical protein
VAFGNVVPVPRRDLNHDLSRLLDYRLAAEARVQRKSSSHIEAIGFIVVHLREQLLSFMDNYVTGRTGAVAATGVIEKKVLIDGDIKNRLRLPVLLVGELAMLELKRLVGGQESESNCIQSCVLSRCRPFIFAGFFCHIFVF